ncbi:unnamed protein product [Phytomonas sp. EM1]|nr:unnamed protein product [Phytomonas sp. EM1]|eukprot:CCW63750.1 unnamed protein product [Phytomonas sp. isolate EM1]
MSHISELAYRPRPNRLSKYPVSLVEPICCGPHGRQNEQDDPHDRDAAKGRVGLSEANGAGESREASPLKDVSGLLGDSADRKRVGEVQDTRLDGVYPDQDKGLARVSRPTRSMPQEASQVSTGSREDALSKRYRLETPCISPVRSQYGLSNAKTVDPLPPRSPLHHLVQILVQSAREDEKLLFLAQLAAFKASRNIRILELYFEGMEQNTF